VFDQAVLEACGWSDLSVKEAHCDGGLPPSIADEEAPSLLPNGIDGFSAFGISLPGFHLDPGVGKSDSPSA
jgi:hypothetical protein